MTRNIMMLACAGLFAIGLSFGSFAGSAPDADSDGVPDLYDNCSVLANGPLAATGSCSTQLDTDLDGYGNPCDFDVDNDGFVALSDLGATVSGIGGTDLTLDFDCDGFVALSDLGSMITAIGGGIGPSGLACAGTVPCFAQ